MEFDSIRPILSGLAGGLIAIWLGRRWSRQLPSHYNAIPREELLQRHRTSVNSANLLFLSGIFFGIGLYQFGGFASNDWRPFGLGFGIASVAPLIAIALISVLQGRDVQEAYVAFAWGQDTPRWVTYGILGAGVMAFFWSVISLAT